MILVKFCENRKKVKKWRAAAHRAQTLSKPMVFHRYFWPLEPESGKSAKKCHFHKISLILMKMSENGLKSAISTHFHQISVKWVKILWQLRIRYLLKHK